MLSILLAGTIGAFTNRFRGGGVLHEGKKTLGTQLRRITYAILGALVFAIGHSTYEGVTEGVATYSLPDALLILGVMLVLFFTLLTGWGRALGALGGWESEQLVEFKPIDYLTTKILTLVGAMPETKRRGQGYVHHPVWKLRLWGFVWLILWGLATGGLLALTTGSLFPLVGFGSMGLCYGASMVYARLRYGSTRKGWPLGEWVFGFVSFVSLIL